LVVAAILSSIPVQSPIDLKVCCSKRVKKLEFHIKLFIARAEATYIAIWLGIGRINF